MDGFADAGYLTLGLDYFRGVSILPSLAPRKTITDRLCPGSGVETPQNPNRHDDRTRLRLRGLEGEAYGFLRRGRSQVGEGSQGEVWEGGYEVRLCWVCVRID